MSRNVHKPSCNAASTKHPLMTAPNHGLVGAQNAPSRKKPVRHTLVAATKGPHVPQRNPVGSTTTTWLTPRYITQALGPFDLDPCTPPTMPWSTATRMLTEKDDGLATPWRKSDFVWHNPPYGKGMDQWMAKAAEHGNGFTLIFNRSDTKYFHESVNRHPNTTAKFEFQGRLRFCNELGIAGKTAASPSILIAYGEKARRRLIAALKAGKLEGRLTLLGEDQRDVWQLGCKAPRLKKAA
jgi:hypothetical protein